MKQEKSHAVKGYTAELILSVLQLGMFYLFPITAGPTDGMGMVVLILLATFVIGVLMGALSGKRIKFLFPVAVAAAFVPSVWIWYNESALIHSVWYLVDSGLGLALGSGFRRLSRKL